MRNFKTIPIFLSIIITIVGCQKEPTASFITDKNVYVSGDTVHLTNTSTNANSYLWTMPDGVTLTTNNTDYITNVNQGFGTLTFKLEAFSNNGKKNNTATESVAVIPAPIFYYNNNPPNRLHPSNISCALSGNNWLINVFTDFNPVEEGFGNSLRILISLPGTIAPAIAGIYTLQPIYNSTLAPGFANINIYDSYIETVDRYSSLSGQLQITITNGKVHAIFNQIEATHTQFSDSLPNVKISGDIICP